MQNAVARGRMWQSYMLSNQFDLGSDTCKILENVKKYAIQSE